MDLVDIVRILAPGILLGILVGMVVASRPFHLERLRPRFWLRAARRMKKSQWVRLITVALWVAAASLVITNIISNYFYQIGTPLVNPEEYPFTQIQQDYPWLVLIAANILPVFEEWVFRAILIDELIRRGRSKAFAVFSSSLLFAAFHLSNPGTYLPFVLTLVPSSILLGICYLKVGLGGALFAHNSYNSFLVIVDAVSR
ncbi:MAG: CPBP family intramembrane glutamic endopeptidase [Candidatus Hadarchaeota archaeon]